MLTTATHNEHDNTPEAVLFLAFELRENTWKLGYSVGHGQKLRQRTVAACDRKRLLDEVTHAKVRSSAFQHRLSRALPTVAPPRAVRPPMLLAPWLDVLRITQTECKGGTLRVDKRESAQPVPFFGIDDTIDLAKSVVGSPTCGRSICPEGMQ